MTHMMKLCGLPGRRDLQCDAPASGKGRNAPGGSQSSTGGRFPLTARGVAARLWRPRHGTNRV